MLNWKPVNLLKRETDLTANALNEPLKEIASNLESLKQEYESLTVNGSLEAMFLNNVECDDVSRWDVVYLDQDSESENGVFKKALASCDEIDEFVAGKMSYAAGMVTNNSGTTIAISGKIEFSVDFDFTTILEEGEDIRSGPYYLSSRQSGKLTANPNIVETYIGWIHTGENPYIILSPRVEDMGRSHIHRTYNLSSKVVGNYVLKDSAGAFVTFGDATPSATHHIVGADGGSTYGANAGAIASVSLNSTPSLKLIGSWDTSEEVSYELKLNDSTSHSSDNLTATFSNGVYMHWATLDSDEDGYSAVLGFGVPFAIGTYGLMGVLESTWASDTDDWNKLRGYAAALRWYNVELPEVAKGWRERNLYTKFTRVTGTSEVYLIGGPFTSRIKYYNELKVVTITEGGYLKAYVQDKYNDTYESIAVDIFLESDGSLSYKQFELDNGASIIFVGSVTTGEEHTLTFVDEAPLACFEYATAFHKPLNQFFPPIPKNSCNFILNGIEQDQYDAATDSGQYLPTTDSLVWVSNAFNNVPFIIGADSIYDKKISFSFIRTNVKHTNYVTSLVAADDSPFEVVTCGSTEKASQGSLEIRSRDLPANHVTKLTPGPGVSISNLNQNAEEGSGELLISLTDNYAIKGSFEEFEVRSTGTDTLLDLIGIDDSDTAGWEYIDYVTSKKGDYAPLGNYYGFPFLKLQSNYHTTAFLTIPFNLPAGHDFRLFIYMEISPYMFVVAEDKIFGLDSKYSVLKNRFLLYGDGDKNLDRPLVDNLETYDDGGMRSLTFYKDRDFAFESGYYTADVSYPPILIHNNPLLNDIPYYRYRLLNDLPHTFKPGDKLYFNFRQAFLEGAANYLGNTWFMNPRWELLDMTAIPDSNNYKAALGY